MYEGCFLGTIASISSSYHLNYIYIQFDILRYQSTSGDMFIYYTDHHEVDEDLRAIAIAHAGMYQDVAAGQMVRDLYYVSDTVSDKVAFEKKINRPIRR